MSDSFERKMTRQKQRLINEVRGRSEKLRCATKAEKERLTKELEASRKRLEKLNGSPEGEV